MDGTRLFSSKKIHCDNCSTTRHKDRTITYYHEILNCVIVAPGQKRVIPLMPEFILPQDGSDKQDCENAVAKRWIRKYGQRYSKLGVTILGDDLYSNQPMCNELKEFGFNFILVCKPDSHKTLYDWVEFLEEGVERHTVTIKRWNGKNREIYTYRYANNVPIRDSEDALYVNWFELRITTDDGEVYIKMDL